MHRQSLEFEQAEAHFAARLHAAEFVKHHPEYLAQRASFAALIASDPNINPVFAAAVTQSLDPRDNQGRRLSPDQGTLGERLGDIDGSTCSTDEADEHLEQSPETGVFPHDA